MKCKASRRGLLAQGYYTSCRSHEYSEDGRGHSERCHWSCLPTWRGNRRHLGWWCCDISTIFVPSLLLLLPLRLWLMRLMFASLLVLPLPASMILLTDSLDVGTFVLRMAELVAGVAVCVADVPCRHLRGDAASRDTS